MSLSDFFPECAFRDPRGLRLSQMRIEVLGELIDAYQAQIEAINTDRITASTRHAATIMVLAERLKAVHLLWKIHPTSSSDTYAESTIADRYVRHFCAYLIEMSLVESSIYPPPPTLAEEIDSANRTDILRAKIQALNSMVEAKRRWEQVLESRVETGFFGKDPDGQGGLESCFADDEISVENPPHYQELQQGPPAYNTAHIGSTAEALNNLTLRNYEEES